MNTEENYIEINRQSWNNRTDTHLKSEFYDLNNFIKGPKEIFNFVMDRLPSEYIEIMNKFDEMYYRK